MHSGEPQPRSATTPSQNQLLASLSVDELSRIKQELVPVYWRSDRILLERMDGIRHVWFPATCVASLAVAVEQGCSCEAAIIGADGIVGYEAFLGSDVALSRQVVQIGGVAYQLPLKRARFLFNEGGPFYRSVISYISALHAEILQSVACHGLHSGRMRLARILLQIQDRAHGNPVVNLTHEMLANVLGVQRTTVTAAAMDLQQEGLIAYRRGRIEIHRRDRLEYAACECYGAICANFERFLPRFRGPEPGGSSEVRIPPPKAALPSET